MKFIKMHGLGNDYVYINCFEQTIENPREIAIQISDRHFGVGADGIILIEPSEIADCKMRMFNADGSQAEMCGNGIRCLGKYVYECGIVKTPIVFVETMAGIRQLELEVREGKVTAVTVNMGRPKLKAEDIPVLSQESPVIQKPLTISGQKFYVNAVSMGNPHGVIFMEKVTDDDMVKEYGYLLEHHSFFPKRANIEFVQVLDETHIRMRVWERGAGETLACGTGACAATVAAILNGYVKREVIVQLPGGNLKVSWMREDDCVYLTGSAEYVFLGEVLPEFFPLSRQEM